MQGTLSWSAVWKARAEFGGASLLSPPWPHTSGGVFRKQYSGEGREYSFSSSTVASYRIRGQTGIYLILLFGRRAMMSCRLWCTPAPAHLDIRIAECAVQEICHEGEDGNSRPQIGRERAGGLPLPGSVRVGGLWSSQALVEL